MEDELTTLDCLILLQSAYPRMAFGAESVMVYELALADINPKLLRAAVLKHISNSKWFPAIAELRGAATDLVLQSDEQPLAPEAWGQVLREVRRVGHWGTPRLLAAVRQAVEAIGGWRQVCFSENITADRARFLEAYTMLRKREAERIQQLPEVREMQEALAGGRKQLSVEENRVDGDKQLTGDGEG